MESDLIFALYYTTVRYVTRVPQMLPNVSRILFFWKAGMPGARTYPPPVEKDPSAVTSSKSNNSKNQFVCFQTLTISKSCGSYYFYGIEELRMNSAINPGIVPCIWLARTMIRFQCMFVNRISSPSLYF